MIVDVASARELQALGTREFDPTLAAEARDLEVRLAPGRYAGPPVDFGSVTPRERVILRAADPDRPPQITDLTLRVRAEHIRLEHLVFSGTRRSMPVIDLQGRRVDVQRCAIVGCRLDSPPGGRLVALTALAGTAGATAALDDCWFVDSHSPDPGTALVAADGFSLAELSSVVFLGNDAPVTLVPRATTVRLSRCVAGGDGDEVFVALTASDTSATFDSCVLAWPEIDQIVTTTGAGQTVRVRRSALACRSSEAGPIELEDVTFFTPSPDREPAIAAARGAARQTDRPDLAGLAATLGLIPSPSRATGER